MAKPLDWQVGNIIATRRGDFYEIKEKKGDKMYRILELKAIESDPKKEHIHELLHPNFGRPGPESLVGLTSYTPVFTRAVGKKSLLTLDPESESGRFHEVGRMLAGRWVGSHGRDLDGPENWVWRGQKYLTNKGGFKWNKETPVLATDKYKGRGAGLSGGERPGGWTYWTPPTEYENSNPHWLKVKNRYLQAEKRTDAGKTILKAMKKHSERAGAQKELLQRAQQKNGIPYASMNEYIMRPNGDVAKLHIYKAMHGISGELSPEQLKNYRATLKNKKIYQGV